VLAIGMQRILKKGAIVKNLLATETLGSTEVIAVDKTGTLTTGEMRVVKIVTADTEFQWETGVPELTPESAAEQIFVIRIGVLCNNAYVAQQLNSDQTDLLGDSTERALFMAGESLGLARDLLEKQHVRIDEIPFNSKDKFMMTLNKFDEQHNIIYLKGAPEKVLLFCNYIYSHHVKEHLELNSYRREKIVNAVEEMSSAGLRVVAVGYKKVSVRVKTIGHDINLTEIDTKQWERLNMRDLYTNFVLVGLIGIVDPIRESVKEAVCLAKKAGIKTIMITGDHKLTAKTVAEKIGFKVDDGHVINGEELDKLSDTDLLDKIEKIQVYARVTPADKMRIIKAWQSKQAIIAMTGDGINDAPALKQANIGLVVNNGNDVVKEAADMILIKNDFGTIVEAVKQGRIIFENIKKIILYFLSNSLVEMMVIIFSLIVGWPLPILATQIIWVNLMDDSFLGMSLTNDPVDFNVMNKRPQKITEEVLNKKRKKIILITSLFLSIIIIFSFWLFWQNSLDNLKLARTVAFALLGFNSLFSILSLRNLYQPVWQTKPWQSPWLMAAMALGFLMQIWAVENNFWQNILTTQKLNWWQWLYVVLASLMTVVVIEVVKRFFYPIKKKNVK
ncbi:MAG TPA: cation-transporting P-type ATPase, partial [bacterium]|nr:cation-transporting P-type ATPase [bacterium]